MRTLLLQAQRPLVIAGGGGWTQQAAAALQRFAENWQFPVANAFRFQDTFDNHHPLYAGDVGLGINPALGRAEHHESRWMSFDEAIALAVPRLQRVLGWARETISAIAKVSSRRPSWLAAETSNTLSPLAPKSSRTMSARSR